MCLDRDATLPDVVGEILLCHLDVLAAYCSYVGLDEVTFPVFEHLLHGLKYSCGVDAVFFDLCEVGLEHVNDIHTILVVVGCHLLFVVLEVFGDVFY